MNSINAESIEKAIYHFILDNGEVNFQDFKTMVSSISLAILKDSIRKTEVFDRETFNDHAMFGNH